MTDILITGLQGLIIILGFTGVTLIGVLIILIIVMRLPKDDTGVK